MADSPHTSVRNQNRGPSERPLLANVPSSLAQTRQVYADSIQRLEHIVAAQEDRLKKVRHPSVGSPSQTDLMRASMEDSLEITKLTLQQIRQSADTLELAWAIL